MHRSLHLTRTKGASGSPLGPKNVVFVPHPKASPAWSLTALLAVGTLFGGCSDEPVEDPLGWPGIKSTALRRQADPPIPAFDARRWIGTSNTKKCAATCPPGACNPKGVCCPAGEAWSTTGLTCRPVGPVGCKITDAVTAAACKPGWCQRWSDATGKPCPAGAPGCWPSGRPCGASDDAASRCAAGTVRSATGSCEPAGQGLVMPAGHKVAWQSTVPPVLVPAAGPPALAALQEATPPRWCTDSDASAPKACPAPNMGCSPGEVLHAAGCAAAGSKVAACPPGFAPDEVAKPADGVAGCAAVAAACGKAPFGNIKPAVATYFVDPGAAAGGDGSVGKPFKTLADGLKAAAGAPAPPTVALAAGTYTGSLDIGKSVTIRGRCAASVTIAGAAGLPVIGATDKGLTVTLQDLRLLGGGQGVLASGGAKVNLKRVHISLAADTALRATEQSIVTANSLVIEGGAQSNQPGGRGVRVDDIAKVGLTDVRITGCRDRALYVSDIGTSVVATRVYIDHTGARAADGKYGRGIEVRDGARLLLTGAVVAHNLTTGIYLEGSAAGTRLVDVRVADTEAAEIDGSHGEGVAIINAPGVELRALDLADNRTVGLAIEGSQTQADAANLRVSGTRPRASDSKGGRGVDVGADASVTLAWLHLLQNRRAGLALDGYAVVTLSDGLIEATQAEQIDDDGGFGVELWGGAALDLSNLRLHANRDVGLRVGGVGTNVHGKGLVVDGTLARTSDGTAGRGVLIDGGANLSLSGGRLSANRDAGLMVRDVDSWAIVNDLIADGTLARQADGRNGHGVAVTDGAVLSWSGGRCSGNRSVGFVVDGAGSKGTVAKLLVDGTVAASVDRPEGYGVAVLAGGWLSLKGSSLLQNSGVGLFATGTETMATVTDLIVGGTAAMTNGEGGYGVAVDNGGRLILSRARLSDNRGAGLLVEGSLTSATVTDLLADHTRAAASGESGGRGIAVQHHAVLRLRRSWLIDNRDVGLYASDADTRVDAADLWIATTGARASGSFGHGAMVEYGAALLLAGARFDGQAGSGVVAVRAIATLDGLLLEAGPPPAKGALVAGVAASSKSVVTLRGSRLLQPFRIGVAGARSELNLTEVAIAGAAFVAPTPPRNQAWDQPADGIAAFEGVLDLERSVVTDSGRAALLQTNAASNRVVSSALYGGRYGVVAASGSSATLDATVVAGQSEPTGAAGQQLAAPVHDSKAGQLVGASTP